MKTSIEKLNVNEINFVTGGGFVETALNATNALGSKITETILNGAQFMKENLPQITSDTLKLAAAITIPPATFLVSLLVVKLCKIIPPPMGMHFRQHTE